MVDKRLSLDHCKMQSKRWINANYVDFSVGKMKKNGLTSIIESLY